VLANPQRERDVATQIHGRLVQNETRFFVVPDKKICHMNNDRRRNRDTSRLKIGWRRTREATVGD
jgi:hypothetical protein